MSPPELQRTREKNPTLELNIISANDVSLINVVADKMDVYAVVSITCDNTQKKQSAKTPIDFYGGSNPTWNHTVKFSVNEEPSLLTLKVRLFSYWLQEENDLYLGEVNVLVQELLAQNPLPPLTNGNDDNLKLVTYPLQNTERANGRLSFSYRFKPAVPVDDYYPSAPDYTLAYGQPIYPYPDPLSSGQPVTYSPQFQTTGAKLTLELMIKSAKDITKLHMGSEMNVYASVMIHEGNTKTTTKITKTPVVYCAYRNPRWDHEVKFSLDEKSVLEGHLTLIVRLVGVRKILGDKHVGEVKVPIQELFRLNPPSLSTNVNGDNGMSLVTRDVSSVGSFETKGTLSFTYRFLAEQASQQFFTYPIHVTSGHPTGQPRENSGLSNGQLPSGLSNGQLPSGLSNGQLPSGLSNGQLPSGLSNGQLPINVRPQYHQPHGYQPLYQPLLHTINSQSHQYQMYAPPQPQLQQQQQLQPLPQQLPPTQSNPQTESARPTAKPQGGSSIAAVGLGAAAIMGRVIGGALLGDMVPNEVNMFEADA